MQRFKVQQHEAPDPNVTEADFERRMNEYDNNWHGLVDFYRDLKLQNPSLNMKIVDVDTMGKKLDDIFKIAKDQVF